MFDHLRTFCVAAGVVLLAAGCVVDDLVAAEDSSDLGLATAPQSPADASGADGDAGPGEPESSWVRVPPPPPLPAVCTQAIADRASERRPHPDDIVPARHRSTVSLRDRLPGIPARDRVPPDPPRRER